MPCHFTRPVLFSAKLAGCTCGIVTAPEPINAPRALAMSRTRLTFRQSLVAVLAVSMNVGMICIPADQTSCRAARVKPAAAQHCCCGEDCRCTRCGSTNTPNPNDQTQSTSVRLSNEFGNYPNLPGQLSACATPPLELSLSRANLLESATHRTLFSQRTLLRV